jgi:hypothetical protein
MLNILNPRHSRHLTRQQEEEKESSAGSKEEEESGLFALLLTGT